MDYATVLAQVTSWAQGDDNVRALVLTGSAAAGAEHPLSDRDLEVHARDTSLLELDDSWWNALGEVLAVERLENADEQPTRLVYYAGGKLDFTLVALGDARGVYDRPFRVLLDKDDAAREFTLVPPGAGRPRQEEFDECANWAAAAALMMARAIARDEPWSAMVRDADLKAELLRMIEWDHRLRHGADHDVRYLGTRMRQWMDEDVQRELEAAAPTFGRDNRTALVAGVDLLERLARRVSRAGGLTPFPFGPVRREVLDILRSGTSPLATP